MLEKVTNTFSALEKALDASWLRNEVIAQNIANVDTPGYKRQEVAFEEYLDKAMTASDFKGNTSDKRHVSIGGGSLDAVAARVSTPGSGLSVRLDENNVDIESEMADMAENTIRYNMLVTSLNAGYSNLKYVISEGGK